MNWLKTHGKLIAWISLLLLFVFFSSVLFPARRERLVTETGLDKPVADVWLFFTPAELADALPHFPPATRQYYALTEVTLDLAFPLIYGGWLYLSLAGLFSRLPQLTARWQVLRFAPILLIAADLLENASLALNFVSYPPRIPALLSLASAMSAAKWILGIFCVTLLLVTCLVYLGRVLRGRPA
jgi:hypothetical protein